MTNVSRFQPAPSDATAPPRSEEERQKLITDTIEQLRPGMQADGGDIELVAIEGHKVKVRLKGACSGCSLANETLGGVRRTLMHVLGGGPILVVPAL
jgi:Thioredoxin-like proteins and domains